MIRINMAVTADTAAELVEALKNAGPNVTSFYGEVKGTNVQTASEPEPEAPEPGDSCEEKPTVTSENPPAKPERAYALLEVRAELAKVRERKGGDAMRALLAKYGADKLADLDASRYPALMADTAEALKEDDNAC